MDDLIPLEYDKNTNKKPSGDLENVITHLKKGNDAQALKHCNAIIDSHPNLPKNLEQAYFYKGLILHKRGDLDAAEDCYRQSIVLNADNPSSLHCLASILKNKKQLLNAEKFWKQCLALEAKFTEASIGLATLYLESKKNDLAYSHLMTVLKSQPQNSQAKEMLQQAFNLTERIRQLESRVKQDLDNRDLYDELALMYAFTENVPQAIRAFKLAIKNQHSGDANVFNYFGALAFTNRSPEEDVTAIYKKGIESHLDEWSLYNNLAYCLIKYGRYEEAQKMLKKAIHLGPQESMPYFNLGFFYYHTHQYEEAFKVEKKCLALDPHNLKALSLFINSAQHMADWKTVDEYSPKLIQLVGHHIKNKIKLAYYPTPFLLLTLPISNEAYRSIMQYQKSEPTKKYNPTYRNKSAKIRIAYLSPDFTTNHPIGLLINQVFDLHDSEQFETFGYGLTDYHDAQSKVIEQSFDHFTPLARDSDEVAAEKIHQDDIHILVDLAGYTRSARQGILQYQPAPLQIQYLGFTASMQVNYIQYHITCKEIVTESLQPYFSEKLIYLPEGNVATHRITPSISEHLNRKNYGLPENGAVFCCFSKTERINKTTFTVWMSILKNVPNSVLWLYEGNASTKNNLCQFAESQGVNSNRLIFNKSRTLTADWPHCLADLWLDNLTLSAGTGSVLCTTAGVPILTLAGETPQSRVGAGIATAANLKRMITYSIQEYKDKAIDLGNHPQKLAALKAEIIRTQKEMPLFKPERFIRHLETAYKTIWQRFLDHKPTENIYVEKMH